MQYIGKDVNAEIDTEGICRIKVPILNFGTISKNSTIFDINNVEKEIEKWETKLNVMN